MCGIAGIIGKHAVDFITPVKRMMSAMAHRGPDGEGIYVSPSNKCVLGHRRLTILDLTDSASQPMVEANGKHVLCYNGECYNFIELRREMQNRGESFTSSGDTEVVFKMLSRRGLVCLEDLNAMFSLAFWDETKQTLLLARDRFGQKPLYFTYQQGMLFFASEVRALLASEYVPLNADAESMCNFFSCGFVPGPKTIVEDVRLLPAGHFLAVPADGIANLCPRSFWSAPRKKIDVSSEELKDMFTAAVKRHLISDVPVGVFLSGGIDSSAIAAGAMKEMGQGVTTLCVVFPDQPGESERLHAKRVAQAIGSDHIEVSVTGSSMVELARSALEAMDQPTVDGVNTYVVSHAARKAGLKVALSGLGGDELFGGYHGPFTDPLRLIFWKRKIGPLASQVSYQILQWLGPNPKLSKMADGLIAPEGLLPAYLVRRRLFTSRQIRQLFPCARFSDWYSGIPHEQFELLQQMICDREPSDALGLLEMAHYMGQQLLRDTDVMGMANSLELRVPFLDRDFALAALRLPSTVRVPGKLPKHRFVKAIQNWLPPENIVRKKQGFSMPFETWMVRDLREDVCDGLNNLIQTLPSTSKPFIRMIEKSFFQKPDRVGWSRPWAMFVLGKYLRKTGLHLSHGCNVLL